MAKAQGNFLVTTRGRVTALTKLAVLIAMLLSQATAQGKPEDRVTLSIKNGSLESVLKEIRKQTGYSYALQDRWKAIARPVDISVTDVPVEQALRLCFKDQPFTYAIISRTIVIEERKTPQPKETIGAVGTKPPDGISGTVKNEGGAPLAGATIEIKKLSKKGISDEKGEFILQGIPEGTYQVEISYIGYEKYQGEITAAGGRFRLAVSLKRFTSSLDEVQIIAYGTTTKRLNTGDVTTVKAQDIENQPVSNPILALEGRVPGMLIRQVNGLPGSAGGVQVQIRGWNSLQYVGDPLYIVDGVPYVSETLPGGSAGTVLESTSGNPFNFLNPADIESVDVLKDADATAIYGSRGANGVVLITTKKGKQGNARIDVNMQEGIGRVGHFMKLLDTKQYLEMRDEAFKNDGVTPNPSVDYDVTLWDTTRQTNWQKTLIGHTAHYNDGEVSISGGNETTGFLIGTGLHSETTVFPTDWKDRKVSLHFNISNSSFGNRLKLSLGGSYVVDNNFLGEGDLTSFATSLPPDAPALYNPDGSINWAPGPSGTSSWPFGENPIAGILANLTISTHNLLGTGSISYEIMRDLVFKTTLGYTDLQNTEFAGVPFSSLDPATLLSRQRFSTFTNNHAQTEIVEPQITYDKTAGRLKFGFLAGATIQENRSNGQVLSAQGFSSDALMGDLLAATAITPLSITDVIYKYNALFSRINMNWGDKYIVNLNVRRDGSSRFGPANRFSNFYSVGGAWIFSKESWIQQRVPLLSFGKLRASYGTTGNDQVGDYTYLDLYNIIQNVGVPYQGANGLRPVSIYTPNLQWELTRKIEIGLELGFWHDRLIVKGSAYRNRSTNELVGAPLPSIAGFTAIKENLPALVQNNGWEVEWSTVNVKSKTFRWVTSFNISRNVNLLAKIAPGMDGFYQRLLGHAINTTFLYKSEGVNPITGFYQFKAAQGELVAAPSATTDMTVAMNLDPHFYGGFDNRFIYKRVELDVLVHFVNQKNVGYPYYHEPGSFGQNEPVTVLSRWRQAGDVSNIQRFGQGVAVANSLNYTLQSDATYESASFVRIKNVALSYALPERVLRMVHFQVVKIFIHAQNLFTFTKYQGMDPESLSYGGLPPLRVITFGIQVGF